MPARSIGPAWSGTPFSNGLISALGDLQRAVGPGDVGVGELHGVGGRRDLAREARDEDPAVEARPVEQERALEAGEREAERRGRRVVLGVDVERDRAGRGRQAHEAVHDRHGEARPHAALDPVGHAVAEADGAEGAELDLHPAPVAVLERAGRRGAGIRVEVGGALQDQPADERAARLDADARVEAADDVLVDAVLLGLAAGRGVRADDRDEAGAHRDLERVRRLGGDVDVDLAWPGRGRCRSSGRPARR